MSLSTLVTDRGRAKLATAVAQNTPLALKALAVGDGNGTLTTPTTKQTDLVNEVYRSNIPAGGITTNSTQPGIITQITIPLSEGGWTLREVGLFDEDGELFAVASCPETDKPLPSSGSARELTIRMHIALTETAVVTLNLSEELTVTKSYLEQQLTVLEEANKRPAHLYYMGQL